MLVVVFVNSHCHKSFACFMFPGDKRPYLSLPRPGVSIAPSSLLQCFVKLWLTLFSFAQKHTANLKTSKSVKLDAEVVRAINSGLKHNTSSYVLYSDVTAVHSSPRNLMSLSWKMDGVHMVIEWNVAGLQFCTCRTAMEKQDYADYKGFGVCKQVKKKKKLVY